MLTTVLEWLLDALPAILAAMVVKGFPNWGRPVTAPPITSVQLWGLATRQTRRVGETDAWNNPSVRVTLFGRNEPEMWALVEKFTAWVKATPEATVGGRKVGLVCEPGQRYETQTGAEQEAYGFQFTVNLAW
jgi:hypothetical protein